MDGVCWIAQGSSHLTVTVVPLLLQSIAELCHDGQSTRKLNHHFLTRTALHNAFENPSKHFRWEQENTS